MAEGLTWNVYDANTMTQADIYGDVLCMLGEKNERIVGLSADLAKSTKIGKFAQKYPNRFFNVGIAEQNLFGMAAGLALSGLVPFVSTMAVFTTMRAAEQVRTDICYQNLDVKIIATHGGISFGQAGTTHHCTEDIAIMRSLANMTVVVPADGIECANAVMSCVEHPGPVYIRIGRGFEPACYEGDQYGFTIGRSVEITPGTDITLICCGITVLQAREAAQILERNDGISARVINMHTIKPLDTEAVLRAVNETRRIITFEDHTIYGGLGSAVAEVIAESGKACAFTRVGIPDCYSVVGYPEDLYNFYKLDADGIVEKVREVMGRDFEEAESWEDGF
ncbi:MAG: transketolase C-terminal domain-containing protein [Desulfomonilia bacterium]|nr:transketolase C-terminal domain-containing protein [Desulfomonilia bacterium]